MRTTLRSAIAVAIPSIGCRHRPHPVRLIAGFLSATLLAVAPATGQTPAEAPTFSAKRGFYEAPFQVVLTTATPGATIYYTTDGRTPGPSAGSVYSSPIPVGGTTVLRAAAYAPNLSPSRVKTHSYLFPSQIIKQPKSISGWPQKLYAAGFLEPPEWPVVQYFSGPHDYEMDPEVVNNTAYKSDLLEGLQAIPTMSLVMARDEFWMVNDSDRGSDVERPVSVEIIYPDGKTEHTDGGLVGHSHMRLKRSFRLAFRAEYGDTQFRSDIMKTAPLHGDTAADQFDKLVLRAGNNRTWSHIFNDGRVAYTRDQWYRDSQIDIGGVGSRGNFVHLYVNGLYWGLYNVAERPDAAFTSDYLGGEYEDWYAWSSYSSVSGDPAWFNYLWQTINRQDLSDPIWYRRFKEHLDVANFADYLILTWYMGMTDWPQKNFWGGNRNTPLPEPFLHFAWDGEWSFDVTHGSSNGGWVHPWFRRDYTGTDHYIPNTWRAARKSPDFMTLFADRVYSHLSAGGALSDAASRERWHVLNEYIRSAVVAESARWGDAMEMNGHRTRTRALDWEPEVKRLDTIMNGNAARFIAALRAQNYYPAFDPPVFSREGGTVDPGTPVVLTASTGTIYFTTDGSDPRRDGGGVSPSARSGGRSVTIPVTIGMKIRSRVESGGVWSALNERTFYTTQDLTGLVINEIHYHPIDPGGVDPDAFEFVELRNASSKKVELGGLSFTDGITFTFPVGTSVNAGGYLVLARDAVSFRARYGFDPDGVYAGRLDNDGERLVLSSPLGALVDSVRYDDKAPWPAETDGKGPSLELLDAGLDNALPTSWRASKAPGGSPRQANTPNEFPTVLITSPATRARVDPGSSVTIAVEASDPDGSVVRVDFFAGSKKLGEDTAPPYAIVWTPPVGRYVLTAVVRDNIGAQTVSDVVEIEVRTEEPCTPEPPAIVFNEINYNSAEDLNAGDWVEIFNRSPSDVDMSGWVFKDERDTNTLILPEGSSAAASGYLLLVESDTLFISVHPDSIGPRYVFGGPAGFNLSNGGEALRLFSPTGCLVDSVTYGDAEPWPIEPDGLGPTLSLLSPSLDNGDPTNWRQSSRPGGSPGRENVPNTRPSIELIAPVDGLRVEPGSDVLLEVNATDPDEGGSVAEVAYFAGPVEIGRVATAPFHFQWSRPPVGSYTVTAVAVDDRGARATSGEVRFVVQTEIPCAPAPAAVVITEINYHPDPDSSGGDWIELFAPAEAAIDLSGWVLKDAIDAHAWEFEEGTLLAGLSYLAVAEDTSLFRNRYGAEPAAVGPFGGATGFSLGNDGDHVRLYSPTGCLVEEVDFSDLAPWPAEPDGSGYTLSLLNPGLDNSEPASWGVSTRLGGSPGAENAPNAPPTVQIVAPVDAQSVPPGQSVRLAASASDADAGDTVVSVSYVVEDVVIATATEAPFEVFWQTPPVGSYVVWAEAQDNRGVKGQSTAVRFSVATEAPCEPQPVPLAINEISYHSGPVYDAGDWIELHNPATATISLADWTLKDARSLHAYVFDVSAGIGGAGYAVVAADSLEFARTYADLPRPFGPLGFELPDEGTLLRLYSPTGCLVDSLTYRSTAPWPNDIAETGRTLALRTSTLDNAAAESWAASMQVAGTPWALNFAPEIVRAEDDRPGDDLPTAFELGQNYPNPFNPSTTIAFDVPRSAPIRLSVYTVLGEHVIDLVDDILPAGRYERRFEAANFASGTFVYILEVPGERKTRTMVLLK